MKGAKYGFDTANHSGPTTLGRIANLAIQFQLGLCAQRHLGPAADHFARGVDLERSAMGRWSDSRALAESNQTAITSRSSQSGPISFSIGP